MPDIVSVISHTTIPNPTSPAPSPKFSRATLSPPTTADLLNLLLLRNYDTLDPEKKDRLDELLEINRPLYLIHSMKEQLRLFWNHTDEKKGRHFLAIWCRDAWESGIQQLVDVAKTLALYRSGLLTYFKHRITSGPVEGLVNKIKTLKRQAYGFRDMEYFKLRLYHLHTQRYPLTR